jgi:hypothetical protein
MSRGKEEGNRPPYALRTLALMQISATQGIVFGQRDAIAVPHARQNHLFIPSPSLILEPGTQISGVRPETRKGGKTQKQLHPKSYHIVPMKYLKVRSRE